MTNIPSKFIATEPLEDRGGNGEKQVWNAICLSFARRQSLAYWRYPIFSRHQKFRKEPDILLLDRKLGIVIIEVKSININQIVSIQGHLWQYQNFYISAGNPYQQAENQLFALLEYCHNEPSLKGQISARVLISLPLITEKEWQEKNFHKLPSNPPLLFRDNLNGSIAEIIQKTHPLIKGKRIEKKKWQLLLSIISGTSPYNLENQSNSSSKLNRGNVSTKLEKVLFKFDLQLARIGKQIPPGPQRIRGIAGSGKTVILCQKAAFMHLKYPHWKIAVVFFSRSLYEPIAAELDRWLQYFSNKTQKYDQSDRNLLVLHAWGGKKQPGLYSTICQAARVEPLTVKETESKQPNEALAEVCYRLLKQTAIPAIFDAILIDEGQDLIAEGYKYEDKQAFYWLAYQALRSHNPIHPEQKKLIWTYDETQSLASLRIPMASEILGDRLGHLVTGKYFAAIEKSEIICRCYRTPHLILTAAHALCMGLLRPQGLLTGVTTTTEWQMLGYLVDGEFKPGAKVTLKRPRQNSPNPISQFWPGDLIKFQTYSTRTQELSHLAANLQHNLKFENLKPEKDILVIILGDGYPCLQLENYVARFLSTRGIQIFIPGAKELNQIEFDRQNPNQFWQTGAVTLSRIHRVKGQQANLVYIIGLDNIAKNDSSIHLRNQLGVALTRARAWVNLSGIGSYSFYQEVSQVLKNKDCFNFTFSEPEREIGASDRRELIARYARGSRMFQNIDLSNANLSDLNLEGANLIGANLIGANLCRANLNKTKLIAADLTNATLEAASLKNAKLMGANLENANLENVNLDGADLTDANLIGTELSQTNLK